MLPVSLEITPSDLRRGVIKYTGDLSFDDEALVLTYRTTRLPSRVSEDTLLRLPFSDWQEISLKGKKIQVQPRRFVAMEPLPGTPRDRLVLHIERADKKDAARLVADVQQRLAARFVADPPSLRFRLPDAGVKEIHGLLYLEDDLLVFDLLMGLSTEFLDDHQLVKIEPPALREIAYSSSLTRAYVRVRPKKDTLLKAIPGDYERELKLKLAKNQETLAAQLVARVQAEMAPAA